MRKVVLTATAARDILRLAADVSSEVRTVINGYAAGRPVDASPLRNRDGQIRLRADEYRVIVEVSRATVTVLRARHRSEVYRP